MFLFSIIRLAARSRSGLLELSEESISENVWDHYCLWSWGGTHIISDINNPYNILRLIIWLLLNIIHFFYMRYGNFISTIIAPGLISVSYHTSGLISMSYHTPGLISMSYTFSRVTALNVNNRIEGDVLNVQLGRKRWQSF